MTELIHITDPSDERLEDFAALTDAALRKRYENQRGVLIAEGPNPVRELLASHFPVRSVLLTDERLDEHADIVAQVQADGAPVYVVTREVLYELVRFKLHQGVLACGRRIEPATLTDVIAGADRIAVLEGLGDHENLGTLFRSLRGLGVDGVLLGPGCADPLYRRCVRVSMGHVLHLPFAEVASITQALELLHAHGFTSVAMTPDASAIDLRDVDRDGALAVLVGAEGPGLTDDALSKASVRAKIPMQNGVDSLNVATAATIAFHHLQPRRAGR